MKLFETKPCKKIGQDIAVAAQLEATVLIGPMHSAHKTFTGAGPTDEDFERCVNVLQSVNHSAKTNGLDIAVEPLNRFQSYFLNTAEQAVELIKAVNCANIGVLYDTHHANIEEQNVYQAIKSLGGHLKHFHISESHRGTLGTGSADWNASFKALKEMDYQVSMAIEAFATDVEGIPMAVNIWRNSFKTKQEVAVNGYNLVKNSMTGG